MTGISTEYVMKILKAKVINFGSYDTLEFTPEKLLTLISGSTGSGKSTLCDIIPWCLFGRTAKDGNADEIITWGSKDQTYGELETDTIKVVRTRQPNDLYYIKDDITIRGKDLKDTQKLIDQELGMNCELYLSGAYLNEFSPTTAFFIANAKVRRTIIEQLVDLTFTKNLLDKASDYKKEIKTELNQIDMSLNSQKQTLLGLSDSLLDLADKSSTWKSVRVTKLAKAKEMHASFETIRQTALDQYQSSYKQTKSNIDSDIENLVKTIKSDEFYVTAREMFTNQLSRMGEVKCNTCGTPQNVQQRMVVTRELHKLDQEESANRQAKLQVIRLNSQLEQETKRYNKAKQDKEAEENNWDYQIRELKSQVSPYEDLILQNRIRRDTIETDVNFAQNDRDAFLQEQSDCEQLIDTINSYRELLTKHTIMRLQDTTNNYLSKYFDAEIKVVFESASNDKIDVTILKDGHECVYSQLSKGQRQLLRLCFGVAVMQHISQHHSISFNTLFFDEVFTGLDSNLVLKGFQLLRSLSDGRGIYVVEHNTEAKAMAENVIEVALINGRSELA